MLMATFFDYDGQELTTGCFSLLTRSLYKALVDAQTITGFVLILFANNFAVFGKGKARLVVGVSDVH
ncbi:hypothetical protein BA893_16110 [Vibrio natriegens]|uniref:hypothetical protein n=1 Tax=Vibrio natriegens TaxID=691 RepID=UPI0008043FE5|nr:hypothetical protein [Vibrio natriegens]ANQ23196.1 hypothetical protein BA893_16110 [Vibrio natriegens]